jgi:hypothetical protein
MTRVFSTGFLKVKMIRSPDFKLHLVILIQLVMKQAISLYLRVRVNFTFYFVNHINKGLLLYSSIYNREKDLKNTILCFKSFALEFSKNYYLALYIVVFRNMIDLSNGK